MRVPYSWLREWVEVPWSAAEVGARLTMAGFELEALGTAAPPFSEVVTAEILSCEAHPQADKLQICRVAGALGEPPLQIVCGASNARAGLKTALARVGAVLPGNVRIGSARLRGVDSQGMLASAKELALGENSEGILELSADAPVGLELREYLNLDEPVLDLNVTPNRGDAMSVLGIAREVAALAATRVTGPAAVPVRPAHNDRFPVRLDAPTVCPKFAGCIIRGVDNRATVPLWIRERLRRAGLRSISPLVDVTNYVMLELGQPMHAYDLAKLRGGIVVRLAREEEPLTLLDGRTIRATADMLFITDAEGPVGLGGVMGGARTAVNAETTEVFFESAYFAADAILGARAQGMQTDASQRFERGVDPTQQARAIARAVSLLGQIAGGRAGPIEVAESKSHLPQRGNVPLRAKQLSRLLGISLLPDRVTTALEALGMQVRRNAEDWTVTPPAWRFDIGIEADLIEEVARLTGFESIPETDALVPQRFRPLPAQRPAEASVLEALAARGYQETITYAFVDPTLQEQLFPERRGLPLSNPISTDLSVMRLSLWPGLIRAALENQRRHQDRIRLFEHGTRFEPHGEATREIDTLAAIALGARLPEQWGVSRELRARADFYDLKSDLDALFAETGEGRTLFTFEPGALAALHPGRSARVLRRGQPIGWLGELHPQLVRALEFTYPPALFELDLEAALAIDRPRYAEISRFPQVRRDLAVVVDESITFSTLAERVTLAATSLLRALRVFDVYRGPGLEKGRKSVAFGLIFQDISRTLTDDDVERLMASVVADLRDHLNARIRE